jgi:glutamyl-tRNA(Gln) amidotransferase subunit E
MDYQQLGLKCGIEIHQQLEGRKLFCSCPTMIRDEAANYSVRRKLRASAGETGEIDIAAAEEERKEKLFIYEGYNEGTCLVELDAEPPHPVNEEALYTALQFSKMVSAKISPIIQVMRKTVIDGSNTSGFQRTMLVARNGEIETGEGRIRISGVCLEEDACRIISEKREEMIDEKVYRLDRLGIPLIEVGTEPDIKSPEQCLEAAKKIGLLLRSLPKVKRGLGTIRQDVNVSISGGQRIEIKGAQELRMLPTYVELEAKRQKELLAIKEELLSRKITIGELRIVDLTETLKSCPSKIVERTVKEKGKILGFGAERFKGLFGRELLPGYRVGTELSGRAKAKAGVGGIFHSDELPNYGISEDDVLKIKEKLGCKEGDGFVLVAAEEKRARKALMAVQERMKELLLGVPKEVRKANPDGTTSYLRPIPGAARMYPETDVPLIIPEMGGVELPESLEEKIKRYQKELNLNADLATYIVKSEKRELFEELVGPYGKKFKPAFIVDVLTAFPQEIRKKYGLAEEKISEDNFRELFRHLDSGKIHKDIIIDVLIDMINGKFDLHKYESLSSAELERTVKEIVEKNKGAPFSALMGLCMKELAGKVSGQKISEMLKRIVK